ncbi:MAG: DALR anticodon-binding domain-containing protein [Bacillus subtilis]|nr:DALR anticodon-binding domain-containing protein [Bacillus subtilis]
MSSTDTIDCASVTTTNYTLKSSNKSASIKRRSKKPLREYAPSVLAKYLLHLASLFNTFYAQEKIMVDNVLEKNSKQTPAWRWFTRFLATACVCWECIASKKCNSLRPHRAGNRRFTYG